jgi:hypothetical protein
VQNAAIQAGAIAYFVKRFDDEAFLAAVKPWPWRAERADSAFLSA